MKHTNSHPSPTGSSDPVAVPPGDGRLTRAAGDEIAQIAVRFGRVRWTVRSTGTVEFIQDVLREPDAFLTDKTLLFKDTFRATIGRIPSPGPDAGGWILRRTNYGPTKAWMRDTFRVASSMRAFRSGLEMERAGIPVPPVLAAGIVRRFHRPVRGYLLVKEVAPVESLVEWLRRTSHPSGIIIQRMAQEIARMHERGFIHGDLTINNILLDTSGQPWFVDLDRVRRVVGPVNWRQAAGDFRTLARHVPGFRPASQRAALRLLKEYCARRGWAGRERDFVTAVFRRLRGKSAARGLA